MLDIRRPQAVNIFAPYLDRQPVTSRPRRLAPDRLRIAKSEFEEMIRNVTARRSDNPWASALHLVPKKEDGLGPCGNYRALNATTVPDQYPVRDFADFAQQPTDRKIFSTIDLVKAYHQIPLYPDDIAKTAIITPFGLSEFQYIGRNFTRLIKFGVEFLQLQPHNPTSDT